MINITVNCDECNTELNARWIRGLHGTINIEPCKTCLDAAREEGRNYEADCE